MGRRHAAMSFIGTARTHSAAIRGGKGSSLAIMTDLGLPVPPGFTLSTTVARAHMEHGRISERALAQIDREIRRLEELTGHTFGDPSNPLLVSVRSGAEQSMPGMMDTVLNVGLDPQDLSGLKQRGGKRFACNTRDRFLSQWRKMFYKSPSCNPRAQLLDAIEGVLRSWNSERAIAYRDAHGIPHNLGTAVTVQAMVFGNIDQQSCTGVVFSADVATGKRGLYGEFLPRAQGEDVVSGSHTPQPIAEMQSWNPKLYAQLEEHVRTLEDHYSDVVDVEFTVEKGVLYILQCRKAKRSPLAQVIWAVRSVWDKKITKQQALARVSAREVNALCQPSFSQQTIDDATVITQGLAASPGAVTGVVALTSEQAQEFAAKGWSVVLVREDTSPDDLPGMLVSKAIVTANGGATSHAAVVARELGLPAVVGCRFASGQIVECAALSVDGSRGLVLTGGLPLEETPSIKEVNLFIKWWKAAHIYEPRIGFEWFGKELSANIHLNDFYLTEMMQQVCAGTTLENKAHMLRSRVHREVAESFALYLLIAVAGESRHYHNGRNTGQADEAVRRADAVVDSTRYKAGDENRHLMHAAVVSTLKKASPEACLKYVEDIFIVFDKGNWDGSFGGEKWAVITKALRNFLNGTLSLTLFVDHMFDLEHNGGRLFNKNPMFTKLTKEGHRRGDSLLQQQLDIKKSVSEPANLYRRLSALAKPSPEVEEMWGLVKKMVL